jgi:lipoprotein-releasing system ATP-binding protein
MTNTLVAENISKNFPTRDGELVILRDVSLTLDAGESVSIMGPSGSGKSTLLNIVGTLDAPSGGRVMIEGRDPFTLPEKQLARFRNRRIGFIFQEHHLLPQCSVIENVLLPTLAGGSTRAGDESDARPNKDDVNARAMKLLDRVGLSHRLEHRPAELSGGERQRVAIARSLINGPALLLADEPTGNLDGKTAESVAELLVQVFRDEGCALVVVTHAESLARRFDRVVRMEDGMLR